MSTATMQAPVTKSLTFNVTHQDNPFNRCKKVSVIRVMLGDMEVAYRQVGGNYDVSSARKLFNTERQKFTIRQVGWDMARALNLV